MKALKKATPLVNHWLNFVEQLATTKLPYGGAGLRKIVHGCDFVIPGEAWRGGVSFSFLDLGYKNDTSKMKQLVRNYFNQEAITELNGKLKARVLKGSAHTTGGTALGAAKKRKASLGFCMQSVVITHFRGTILVDFFYRSTEILQKFGADLKFIHEKLLPEILADIPDAQDMIKEVRFHFASVSVSAMFLTVYYAHRDPANLLKMVEKIDKKWWRIAMIDAYRLLRKDTTYKFRLHATMWEFFQRVKVDRERLTAYLKAKKFWGNAFRLRNQGEGNEEDDE
jgi:hypothetical protein